MKSRSESPQVASTAEQTEGTVLVTGPVSREVTPTIVGPSTRQFPGSPPTFQVSLGSNRFYAVEVATRPELFDYTAHGTEREAENFYPLWDDATPPEMPPLESNPSYTLPEAVWERLNRDGPDQLYYRLHSTSTHTGWENYHVTTPDDEAASAPSLNIVAPSDSGEEDISSGSVEESVPTITGPERLAMDSAVPPSFRVSLGSNRFYAVEVTTRVELFDATSHLDERTWENFYPLWDATSPPETPVLESGMVYRLPDSVWQRLIQDRPERLYYRMHSTETSTGWEGYHVTTPDVDAANAPSIALTPTSSGGSAREVCFPSGECLPIVAEPTAKVVTNPTTGERVPEYWDPLGSGNPLLDTSGAHRDKQLSDHFTVGEFARSGGNAFDRARIDPAFIEFLEELRAAANARTGENRGISVSSGYRSYRYNIEEIDGAPTSAHCNGYAADIKYLGGLTPLEFAKLALETGGCDVRIGYRMGSDRIHVDTRPRSQWPDGSDGIWSYDGTPQDELQELQTHRQRVDDNLGC